MKKVIILYTSAGGGHKSAALTLQETINKTMDWDVEIVNPFSDWCSEYDLVRQLTSMSSEEVYNKYVSAKNHPLFNLLLISGLFLLNLAIYAKKIKKKLVEHWIEYQPDMIISASPFINTVVAESLDEIPKKTAFVTLITDFNECFPKIWIVSKKQNILCCSERIVQQALDSGLDAAQIHKLSGMPIGSNFYFSGNLDQKVLRKTFGLNPDIPTGLVLFGSYGNNDMLSIAKHMNNCHYPIQMVFVCGHSTELRKKLQALKVSYTLITTGFIDHVDQYMRCADFIIGKPGGLSVAEAAIMQLPQILKLNFSTLLQERYNAQWVLENKIGISVSNFRNIRKVVHKLLDELEMYHANLRMLHNKAFFEIPVILDRIMQGVHE